MASKWMRKKVEYSLIVDAPPLPPNPLNHRGSRTIKEHYATKADCSEELARERLDKDGRFILNRSKLFEKRKNVVIVDEVIF